MGADASSLFPKDEGEQNDGKEMSDPFAWKSSLARIALTEDMLLQEVPADFGFALEEHLSDARSMVSDERISQLRYQLVPSAIDEAGFWRALFYALSTAEVVRTPGGTSIEAYEEPFCVTPSVQTPGGSPAPAREEPLGAETPAMTPQARGQMDFTPRGTAMHGYDDFDIKTPPRHGR